MDKLKCEQFIFGKRMDIQRAGYELIGCSEGITEEDVSTIYSAFNGCRPSATEIPKFEGAFAVRSIPDGRSVLLRLDRSKQKEWGRNYYLQEHYVVLDPHKSRYHQHNYWLWLTSISEIDDFYGFQILQNELVLNTLRITAQINKAIELLSAHDDKGLRDSIVSALYYTLNKTPITIHIQETSNFDPWIWLTAFSILLPPSELVLHRLYIGRELAFNCPFDISITKEILASSGVVVIDPQDTNKSSQIHQLQLKESYSLLIRRYLEKENTTIVAELINNILLLSQGKISTEELTKKNDSLLWHLAMPTIGLKLAEFDLEQGNPSISDLLWLWCYANDNFEDRDVVRFLPILIRETVRDWGEKEINALNKISDRFPTQLEIVLCSLTSPDEDLLLYDLVCKWIRYTSEFTNCVGKLLENQLKYLISRQLNGSVDLALEWLDRNDKTTVIEKASRLFQTNVLEEKTYWLVLTKLVLYVRNRHDFLLFVRLMNAQQYGSETGNLLINIIAGKTFTNVNQYNYILEKSLLSSKDAGLISPVSFALLSLITNMKHERLFISFSEVISKFRYVMNPSARLGYISDTYWYQFVMDWIFRNNKKDLLGSFIAISSQIGYTDHAARTITDLFIRDPENASNIIGYMIHSLGVGRREISISLEILSTLEYKTRFGLLSYYLLSINSLGLSDKEIITFREILESIENMDTIDFPFQENIYNIFLDHNEIYLCQRILEHKIRSSIIRGDQTRCESSLSSFLKLIETRFEKNLSRKTIPLRAIMAVSYSKSLRGAKRERFTKWLLTAPMNTKINIESSLIQPLTSQILKANPTWFSDDPIVRYFLLIQCYRDRFE